MIGILGNKVGMTQFFTNDGKVIPITLISIGPCTVTQIKSYKIHGYDAIQLGYFQIKKTKLTKPEFGHLNVLKQGSFKYLKEYRVKSPYDFKIGQSFSIEKFKEKTLVDITGQSVGKGFSGNKKRHNFARGPMTHGSKNHRKSGAIGQGSAPGRVFPGKKMSGRAGGKHRTISNLEIFKVFENQNLLIVKGSVPGKPGNLLSIKPSKTQKKEQ